MAAPKADGLIIDDSDLARTAMTRALQRQGLSVVALPSPIGASTVILRQKVRVVVIDVNMPSMQGDKLAKLFRRNRRFDRLGIVLVSGIDADALQGLADDVEADAVVSKDAGEERLVVEVHRLLERR